MAVDFRGKVLYFGPKYIWTTKELEINAVAKLGSMSEASYEEYRKKMNEIASRAGIVNPKLGIGLKYKECVACYSHDLACPLIKEDWDRFKKYGEIFCEYMPNVFVVDGDKFILPT